MPGGLRRVAMRILLTGGCGFIGSAVVRHLIRAHRSRRGQRRQDDLRRVRGRAGGGAAATTATSWCAPTSPMPPRCAQVFATHQPDAVMHLAAESHVDRSIDGPARVHRRPTSSAPSRCWRPRAPTSRPRRRRARARSASTISRPTRCSARSAPDDAPFTETTPYDPRSPYSASKAASDHLVRAWHHTYGLPTIVTNTLNNYGPWQFPEKLIPLVTLNALEGKQLPVYGDGSQRARLALRRGPRRGAGARAGAGRAGRDLRDRRPPAAQQPRRRARDLRASRRAACPTRPARASG